MSIFRSISLELRIITLSVFLLLLHFSYSAVIQTDNTETEGLYTPDDNVEILTVENFKENVFHSKNAWLVEFYNSYCGFCRRFAPVWKEFTSDIVSWQDLVKVGVLDCNRDANIPVCTEFEVYSFPTLIYFHDNYTNGTGLKLPPHDKGRFDDYKENRIKLADVLIKEQLEGRGAIYPNLLPYNYTDLSKLFEDSPHAKYALLVVIPPKSTVGAELTMYYHNVPDIVIRYSYDNNTMLMNLLDVRATPTLLSVQKSGPSQVLTVYSPDTDGFRTAIERFLKSANISVPKVAVKKQTVAAVGDKLGHDDKELLEEVKRIGDAVFQGDLESALRYSLTREVGAKKEITGEQLDALRLYIDILEKYFPFGNNGKALLKEIKAVVHENDPVIGLEVRKKVLDAGKPEKKVFSTSKKWIGCLGSTPEYRGYPCSLWKMFHFLTVNAALDSEFKFPHGNIALRAMHGYVKNFFGCRECSNHFQEMSSRTNIFNVSTKEDSVLWLWKAHNEVNNRLQGDLTEDPEFPKNPFPYRQNCPECRNPNGQWEEKEVYKYLINMYDKRNIKYLGSNKDALAITNAAFTSKHISINIGNLLLLTAVIYTLSGRLSS
ncbi:unnamed protein product [Acanthoscelides obtectus]|uniref:Sulfhydryl oxidase n=1 Tax=Acanthoscelides obtectus TaxID=200917 RepID=A0A9P0K5F1_ACAOB|nr:unnamed protein product [Acanthoscelides obtectus]CAK1652344.1 Sulfhydryl oxidase 1 [Acanthoscelides obtectus]